jgi:hypothetical protein
MNSERLLKMAAFLEALPPHKFGFQNYVYLGSKSPAEALAAPDEHCGTTACAVGWMPAIFPEDFKWVENCSYPTIHIAAKADYEWKAKKVYAFLGLNSDQFDFLFIPTYSQLGAAATAVQVAAQIREFVATDGASYEDFQVAHTMYLEMTNDSSEDL